MVIMEIQHEVRDYDAWKSMFDTFPPSKGGARFYRVNRGTDDGNNVLVVAGFDSLDDAREFQHSPELKERMQDAGVLGAPRFELYEEVEAVEA